MAEVRCVHLVVRGKVQGVWFRKNTQEQAHQRGLTGTVRNTRDGAVEILAQGRRDALDEFIAWCHEGPEKAEVSKVLVEDRPLLEMEGFRIVR